jgi:hypothetical protein
VSTDTTRPAAAWQEPFDAIPRSVQQRDDIVGNAKRLYAALCTAQRTQWQPTYVDLARHLSASARSIVRWVQQLADAGLISVRRRGQGLPNLFTVLALVTSGGATASRPAAPTWQRPASRLLNKREGTKKPGYPAIPTTGSAYLESRRGPIPRR